MAIKKTFFASINLGQIETINRLQIQKNEIQPPKVQNGIAKYTHSVLLLRCIHSILVLEVEIGRLTSFHFLIALS